MSLLLFTSYYNVMYSLTSTLCLNNRILRSEALTKTQFNSLQSLNLVRWNYTSAKIIVSVQNLWIYATFVKLLPHEMIDYAQFAKINVRELGIRYFSLICKNKYFKNILFFWKRGKGVEEAGGGGGGRGPEKQQFLKLVNFLCRASFTTCNHVHNIWEFCKLAFIHHKYTRIWYLVQETLYTSWFTISPMT